MEAFILLSGMVNAIFSIEGRSLSNYNWNWNDTGTLGTKVETIWLLFVELLKFCQLDF